MWPGGPPTFLFPSPAQPPRPLASPVGSAPSIRGPRRRAHVPAPLLLRVKGTVWRRVSHRDQKDLKVSTQPEGRHLDQQSPGALWRRRGRAGNAVATAVLRPHPRVELGKVLSALWVSEAQHMLGPRATAWRPSLHPGAHRRSGSQHLPSPPHRHDRALVLWGGGTTGTRGAVLGTVVSLVRTCCCRGHVKQHCHIPGYGHQHLPCPPLPSVQWNIPTEVRPRT